MKEQNQIITWFFIMGFCFGVLAMCGYMFCFSNFQQSQPIDNRHAVTFRFINLAGSSVQLNTMIKGINFMLFRVTSQNETKVIDSYETGEIINLTVWSYTLPDICVPMEGVIVEVSKNDAGLIEAKYVVG
ncbi:MAG: hypothetical protein WC325_12820 [Candidatus Bathyarchaeia archaeon]|jgi:hypothetical protein